LARSASNAARAAGVNAAPATAPSGSPSGRAPNAGAISSPSSLSATAARACACLHHQVATVGNVNGSPVSTSAKRGRNADQAGASSTPTPGALAITTSPAA